MNLNDFKQLNGQLDEKTEIIAEKVTECKHLWGKPNNNGLVTCKLCGKSKHEKE